jgi:hypothetical protein
MAYDLFVLCSSEVKRTWPRAKTRGKHGQEYARRHLTWAGAAGSLLQSYYEVLADHCSEIALIGKISLAPRFQDLSRFQLPPPFRGKVDIGDHWWIGDNSALYSIAQITSAQHLFPRRLTCARGRTTIATSCFRFLRRQLP